MKTVQMLQSEGALVEVSLLDCGDREEAAQLLADCQRIAPLAGIFHLAMVLEDRLILNHVRACPFLRRLFLSGLAVKTAMLVLGRPHSASQLPLRGEVPH